MTTLTLVLAVLYCTFGNSDGRNIFISPTYYNLYTTTNQHIPVVLTNINASRLSNTDFLPNRTTVFLAHGFLQNEKFEVADLIRKSIFQRNDVNLFIIDWSVVAILPFSVDRVGQEVGEFINIIQTTYNVDGDKFVLIGFGLGAHVVGRAGLAAQKQIGLIVGLDPAQQILNLKSEAYLSTRDAKLVKVLHTEGTLYGISEAIGHIDIYANGDEVQPACKSRFDSSMCSHHISYKYFAEALVRGPEVFKARLCNSYKEYVNGACDGNAEVSLGDLQSNNSTPGTYYLKTTVGPTYGLP